ncbi:oxidoreductase [Sphingomonas xinjiangensis]|uniref:NAD(P)-dependent dehydrogenase (Short-subunit alcohol dehydrogenase family) n=1 Tax=Sphingomonas xinjiangensis TaxID=643568 RepID=A0A840YGM4_9SPHN|nr:oxidoreductase [Sphingomonas xinjiangensis]MBB5711139.1 NAD(P)-dependent dehydrogenase (short-subunit alcohol dehydrogenase family) [Sphingomonas xinjiangensis]
MSAADRTWLITGCSTGFGRALAELLIRRGERVFASARDPEQLANLVDGHPNARALRLDVTSNADIAAAATIVEASGGVDVLVNNAGYGYLTAFEEGEEAGYRAQFETNLFGLIAMTKAVLPAMRARGSGHIVNVASVGGLVGNPGSSYYAATKFGVVGLSEALSKEVGPLGIKVTVVEPGPFRTDWAGRSLQSEGRIDAYAETVHRRLDEVAGYSGRQPGDPVRAAEAIVQAVDSAEPPLNLILGAPGLRSVREKLATLSAEIDKWEAVTLGADYPEQR